MSGIVAVIIFALCIRQGPGVPNFPTPEAAVEQMLDLAGVTKVDTLFDLGCGDGRIVIAAAKRGARGIGVDIDPKCVSQSIENARSAKVTDRTTFVKQDLFKTDIAKATVVALYLSPELDARLRPKLLRELKPGTRVVSHVYDMGEWKPDRIVPIKGSNRFNIFLWILPAAVGGDWRWTARTQAGAQSDTLRLVQTYQRLTGAMSYRGRMLPITDGRLSGEIIEFVAGTSGGDAPALQFKGVVSGSRIEGTITLGTGDGSASSPLTAIRER